MRIKAMAHFLRTRSTKKFYMFFAMPKKDSSYSSARTPLAQLERKAEDKYYKLVVRNNPESYDYLAYLQSLMTYRDTGNLEDESEHLNDEGEVDPGWRWVYPSERLETLLMDTEQRVTEYYTGTKLEEIMARIASDREAL